MSFATLQRVRIVVPGVLALLVGLSLIDHDTPLIEQLASADKLWNAGTVYLGASVALGALYLLTKIRSRLIGKEWDALDARLMHSLVEISGSSFSAEEKRALLRGKRVMNVFYQIVDNDESLKIRRDRVYQNGAIISCLADASFFGMSGALLSVVAACLDQDNRHAEWMYLWSAVFIVSWMMLLPRAFERHQSLSDDQLQFIADHYEVTLTAALRNLLK
jgi:hypothetical protein